MSLPPWVRGASFTYLRRSLAGHVIKIAVETLVCLQLAESIKIK
jgi:hypothetical protein